MKKTIQVRELKTSDLPFLKNIIDDNQLFPPELLDGMTANFFTSSSDDIWLVAHNTSGNPIGVAYVAPEPMTHGTWNILLMAVDVSHQGQGVGRVLVKHIASHLRSLHARVLLVETSGLEHFTLTREFYAKCGFHPIAVIPEYYEEGDDKHVFYKSLINRD